MTPVCENCEGRTLVCENHPDKPWPDGCGCGPGMHCPKCRLAVLLAEMEAAFEEASDQYQGGRITRPLIVMSKLVAELARRAK